MNAQKEDESNQCCTHDDEKPLLLDAGADEAEQGEHCEHSAGRKGQVDEHQVAVQGAVDLQVLVGPVVQPQPQQDTEDGGRHELSNEKGFRLG